MYYFENGLKFECIQCGKCCMGDPGYVFLFRDEVDRIAKFLKISKEEFLEKFTKTYASFYSLTEQENGDCVFLESGKCEIHEVRPYQCFSYPFWWQLVTTEKKWKARGESCPGINKGKLNSREEILKILKENPYYKLLDIEPKT